MKIILYSKTSWHIPNFWYLKPDDAGTGGRHNGSNDTVTLHIREDGSKCSGITVYINKFFIYSPSQLFFWRSVLLLVYNC